MIIITTYRLSPSNWWRVYCEKEDRKWDRTYKTAESLMKYIKKLEKDNEVVWTNKDEKKI
jgi:hypothetical protein